MSLVSLSLPGVDSLSFLVERNLCSVTLWLSRKLVALLQCLLGVEGLSRGADGEGHPTTSQYL